MVNVTEAVNKTMENTVDRMSNLPERTEGGVAKTIEKHTSKVPSDWFLTAAIASVGVSLAMQLSGNKDKSLFIGQWVPTILILGLYNKIVKVAGSDRFDHGEGRAFGTTPAGAR
jgi:hypothetical protein